MKLWHLLLAMGLIGVASFLLVPIERVVDVAMPPMALRALTLIQPALLTGAAVLIGSLTAPKVGFDAPALRAIASGESPMPALRRQWLPAILVGLIGALVLVLYQLGPGGSIPAAEGFEIPLVTRLLYGGITEEIMTRWGLVSLFAWIGWRVLRRPETLPRAVPALAVGLGAALFAVGHLPALHALSAPPGGALVAAVLLGNFIPGALFGTLFVKRGLEAAIMAHMATHLFAAAALAVI